ISWDDPKGLTNTRVNGRWFIRLFLTHKASLPTRKLCSRRRIPKSKQIISTDTSRSTSRINEAPNRPVKLLDVFGCEEFFRVGATRKIHSVFKLSLIRVQVPEKPLVSDQTNRVSVFIIVPFCSTSL